VRTVLLERGAYSRISELWEPMKLMYDSLIQTGDTAVANAKVLDVLRQMSTFELSMMRLDVRQESSRHTEVVDCITTYLGLGSYAEWDEATRVDFLLKELQSKRPLFPPGMDMSPDVKEVVDTIRVLAELPSDSLGAYVISMARTASDVLAVVLLQRECGVKDILRVAPLFETLDDLTNAPATMTTLLSNDWYRSHIKGMQECMIGYSDSGKDAGRLSAAWALFEAQEKIVAIAKQYNVKMVLFHGRGGTVGRGGGPTHLAIRSQPAGTIQGCLRVTVQGEIIEQQFGEPEVCFSTFDRYTSAVLEAVMDPPPSPKETWIKTMHQMSKISCEEYRAIVFKHKDFVPYFNKATPVSELGGLNIGSRPAKRKTGGGVETLRAIPWIFAWTQTRMHLPVWLGLGEALQDAIDKGQLPVLKEMYEEWPFFQGTIDLVEMVLAKADPSISMLYEKMLVPPELSYMGELIRSKLLIAKKAVLTVSGKSVLLQEGTGSESKKMAQAADLEVKISLRAPYVAPLNILQCICLRTLREFEEKGDAAGAGYNPTDPEILDLLSRDPNKNPTTVQPLVAAMYDALLITIKGVAAGMQNTG
jgi:phosphoenolpyruvate carboxylase